MNYAFALMERQLKTNRILTILESTIYLSTLEKNLDVYEVARGTRIYIIDT